MLAVLSVISIVFISKVIICIVVVLFWPTHTKLTINVANLARRGDFWWIYTKFVKKQNNFCLVKFMQICGIRLGHLCVPYFIEYNAHTSIVHTWISQWFLANFIFKNNFTRNNYCKFIHHKSHLKPFMSYLTCIVRREYFSIIFNVKKCALYSIKYGI